jgi:hypothetical protein
LGETVGKETLKMTYRDREIEITVQEVPDETEYLLRSEANREHLLAAKRWRSALPTSSRRPGLESCMGPYP